jgi:hypothetical protein
VPAFPVGLKIAGSAIFDPWLRNGVNRRMAALAAVRCLAPPHRGTREPNRDRVAILHEGRTGDSPPSVPCLFPVPDVERKRVGTVQGTTEDVVQQPVAHVKRGLTLERREQVLRTTRENEEPVSLVGKTSYDGLSEDVQEPFLTESQAVNASATILALPGALLGALESLSPEAGPSAQTLRARARNLNNAQRHYRLFRRQGRLPPGD